VGFTGKFGCGCQIPGQQLFDLADRLIGDPSERGA
jgi:hypothetical protein